MLKVRTTRNSVAKFYLRMWHHLDNKSELNDVESVQRKTLYEALEPLTKYEKQLLAYKYRVDKKPYQTDKMVANEIGMTRKEYQKKRVAIEDKFRPHLKIAIDKHEKELQEIKSNQWSISHRRRVAKNYLSKWYYYANNYEYLNSFELIEMKILYGGLKVLNDKELEFLSNKYYLDGKKNDQIASNEHGMKINSYSDKRVTIEDKMSIAIEEHVKLNEEERSKALDLIFNRHAKIG